MSQYVADNDPGDEQPEPQDHEKMYLDPKFIKEYNECLDRTAEKTIGDPF